MTYNYHFFLAVIAAAVIAWSDVPYVLDTLRGTTKPHPFTWFIWALINIIAFFAQLSRGGGFATLVTAVVVLGCLTIALMSVTRGEKRITRLDWICFLGALLSIVLWILSKDPFVAIVFVTLTDALAFIPTFRKGYLRPFEETASSYALGVVGFVLELVAFQSFNPTTALYPVFIIAANVALAAMLLLRRRQLKTT